MARKAATSPRSPVRLSRDLFDVFLCPSCTNWRIAHPQRRALTTTAASALARPTQRAPRSKPQSTSQSLQGPVRRVRNAFITTASATGAINAPSTVPPKLRPLHAALDELQRKAPEYVNLSQLSLVLRGLESGDAGVTRVAILGFNGRAGEAQKLARLLLADPLTGKGDWEKRLGAGRAGEATAAAAAVSGAVLLKFGDGEVPDIATGARSQLYDEIAVPSPLLQRHNMEILVSTISSDIAVSADGLGGVGDADTPSDAVLIPKLEAGQAGRVTMVRYPTHKAVVVGSGLGDCIGMGAFTAGEIATEERSRLITFAVDLPGLTAQQMDLDSKVYAVTALDLDAADKAVAELRQSTKNATDYEHDWLHSGMPALRRWLLDGVPALDTAGNTVLKPSLQNLIDHLLHSTSSALNVSAISAAPATAPSAAHLDKVSALDEALSTWSRNAHTELRDQLDEAFASRNWAKVAWWKLLWRVDDVTMVAEEVLERRWLLGAEKNGLWLMGRMEQAGLLPPNAAVGLPTSSTPSGSGVTEVTDTVEVGVPTQDMIVRPDPATVSMSSVSRGRTTLEEDTIPQLQATAQRLLLEALSTASLTSSLAALLWLSSTFSVFEAGSVAALGLVWALRRLQRRWEGKREQWEGEVREEGRVCLRDVEAGMRRLLEEARGFKVPEADDWAVRREARLALGKVREELEKLHD